MSLFVCDECETIENTALSRYWSRNVDEDLKGRKLCSACDPLSGEWHGRFARKKFNPETHELRGNLVHRKPS